MKRLHAFGPASAAWMAALFICSHALPAQEAPAPEPPPVSPTEDTAASTEEIRFVHYNLKNWLEMERRVRGEVTALAPKPEAEKTALVRILAAQKPDILGVCEIGAEKDVLDLQARLKAAGVDLPHQTSFAAADKTRRLALFSRFPITGNHSAATLTYTIGEATFPFQRGILDATLQIAPDYELRVLGNHLKSRREIAEGDQAVMRRNEALLVREHAEKILAEAPDTNLLIYGDFNDTKNEQPIKVIQGRFGEKGYLRDLWLSDADGHRFTYYWSFADTYDRIDFAFVSDGLWPEIDSKKSFIAKDEDWLKASDHRPLVITIHPQNKTSRRR